MIQACDLILEKAHPDQLEWMKDLKEEIEQANSLISIEVCDVESLFKDGGEIQAFVTTIDAIKDNRMLLLMKDIKDIAKGYEPYNRVIVYILFPKENSLTMKEIEILNDWIEAKPEDFVSKFGLSIHNKQTIRAIIFLQKTA